MSTEYRIYETKRFLRDLKAIPIQHQPFVRAQLEEVVYPALKANPRHGDSIVKLVDWSAAHLAVQVRALANALRDRRSQ